MDDSNVVVLDDLMDRIIDEQETRLAEEDNTANTDSTDNTGGFSALSRRSA